MVIELNEENRYLSAAAELGIPVIFGDATLRQTLEAARVDTARAVAVLTENDMVNIETGIVLRETLGLQHQFGRLGPRCPSSFGSTTARSGPPSAQRFGFDHVRSTVDLATPWFIGAAMGLKVVSTFSVGQRSFMVGVAHIERSSELDGRRMRDLPTQTRVIAIAREDGQVVHHPRRDAHLLVGRHRIPRRPISRGAGHPAQGAGRSHRQATIDDSARKPTLPPLLF